MFSIVIPSYNNLKYLKSTINSLKKNSTQKYEIIVHVNDGSDGTKDFLKSEGISFSWSKDNVGLCSAINMGVKLSKFKYILF